MKSVFAALAVCCFVDSITAQSQSQCDADRANAIAAKNAAHTAFFDVANSSYWAANTFYGSLMTWYSQQDTTTWAAGDVDAFNNWKAGYIACFTDATSCMTSANSEWGLGCANLTMGDAKYGQNDWAAADAYYVIADSYFQDCYTDATAASDDLGSHTVGQSGWWYLFQMNVMAGNYGFGGSFPAGY